MGLYRDNGKEKWRLRLRLVVVVVVVVAVVVVVVVILSSRTARATRPLHRFLKRSLGASAGTK